MSSAWSITLTCGCTWGIGSIPDLTRPIMCPGDGGKPHGLRSINLAVRNPDESAKAAS